MHGPQCFSPPRLPICWRSNLQRRGQYDNFDYMVQCRFLEFKNALRKILSWHRSSWSKRLTRPFTQSSNTKAKLQQIRLMFADQQLICGVSILFIICSKICTLGYYHHEVASWFTLSSLNAFLAALVVIHGYLRSSWSRIRQFALTTIFAFFRHFRWTQSVRLLLRNVRETYDVLVERGDCWGLKTHNGQTIDCFHLVWICHYVQGCLLVFPNLHHSHLVHLIRCLGSLPSRLYLKLREI